MAGGSDPQSATQDKVFDEYVKALLRYSRECHDDLPLRPDAALWNARRFAEAVVGACIVRMKRDDPWQRNGNPQLEALIKEVRAEFRDIAEDLDGLRPLGNSGVHIRAWSDGPPAEDVRSAAMKVSRVIGKFGEACGHRGWGLSEGAAADCRELAAKLETAGSASLRPWAPPPARALEQQLEAARAEIARSSEEAKSNAAVLEQRVAQAEERHAQSLRDAGQRQASLQHELARARAQLEEASRYRAEHEGLAERHEALARTAEALRAETTQRQGEIARLVEERDRLEADARRLREERKLSIQRQQELESQLEAERASSSATREETARLSLELIQVRERADQLRSSRRLLEGASRGWRQLAVAGSVVTLMLGALAVWASRRTDSADLVAHGSSAPSWSAAPLAATAAPMAVGSPSVPATTAPSPSIVASSPPVAAETTKTLQVLARVKDRAPVRWTLGLGEPLAWLGPDSGAGVEQEAAAADGMHVRLYLCGREPWKDHAAGRAREVPGAIEAEGADGAWLYHERCLVKMTGPHVCVRILHAAGQEKAAAGWLKRLGNPQKEP